MPKYINAENLAEKLGRFVEYDDDGEQEINPDAVFITIDEMPSADVVEVVRCKDCKYSVCIGEHYFCDIQYNEWGEPYIVKPDGFCDCGERKEQDE